jgi:GAF domain
VEAVVSGEQEEGVESVLDLLLTLVPYDYAQWVTESSATWDYTVVASRFPAGEDCYDIAHRPGVIGQVFRRERPIFISDVQAHPLYDAYDPSVEWELAVPLADGRGLVAVLNLEGGGRIALNDALWSHLGEVIASKTKLQLSEATPAANEAWMVKTTLVGISGTIELTAADSALRLGRAVADGGRSVLVAGPLNLPRSSTYPTVEEALATGLPLGGCFRGGSHRLDLLVETSGIAHVEDALWWSLADGRYDFVIAASPRW